MTFYPLSLLIDISISDVCNSSLSVFIKVLLLLLLLLPLMSVTHGQCNTRHSVTFPAARRHHLLAGTKLYCLVTEAAGLQSIVGQLGFELATC